jgi:integrase
VVIDRRRALHADEGLNADPPTLLPAHIAEMARFSLATGLRLRNVTHLEWNSVDLARRVAWMHADQAKNRKPPGVPLNAEAVTVLRRQVGKHPRFVFTYRDHAPVVCANGEAWRAGVRRAGLKDFRWHDLRHTWASWHAQAGTPLHALQELGGWETAAMVRRYAHLAPEHLAEHAERIARPRLVSGGDVFATVKFRDQKEKGTTPL